MFKYLKSAFLFHWNLLAFCGAMGFAALSGQADVAIPIVLAGEAAYLGMLASHPKYQSYVDAQAAKATRDANSADSAESLQFILKTLPKPLIDRFDQLRRRCRELRTIAAELRGPGLSQKGEPLDNLQAEGLDRLLWVHLRLLYTQFALDRFLNQTSLDRIKDDAERLSERLKEVDPADQSPHAAKVRRALEDNLATSQTRITNYEQARANAEFVELEIDRLENKIKSLAEVAINRQEPDFISSEVDSVARSMLETEKTMNELNFATGLGPVDEEIPELMQAPIRVTE